MANAVHNSTSLAFSSSLGSATVTRTKTGLGVAMRVDLDSEAKSGDRRFILCNFRRNDHRARVECYTVDSSGLEMYRGGAEMHFARRVAFEAFEAYHAAPKTYRLAF